MKRIQLLLFIILFFTGVVNVLSGNISLAGGMTDIEIEFSVNIQ